MIDSHAHLTYKLTKDNRCSKPILEQLENAYKNGIRYINTIILDNYQKEIEYLLSQSNKSKIKMNVSVGIHPEDVLNIQHMIQRIKKLEHFLSQTKYKISAIGECGLDYFSAKLSKNIQYNLFKEQINIANSLNLPMILHTRPSSLNSVDAYIDTFKILSSYPIKNKYIMHCFSANTEIAETYMEKNLYIGIAGNITFPNAQKIRDATAHIPLSKILIETDSPFLAPQSHRGEINEPSNVLYVLKTIAQIKEISEDELQRQQKENYLSFFKII